MAQVGGGHYLVTHFPEMQHGYAITSRSAPAPPGSPADRDNPDSRLGRLSFSQDQVTAYLAVASEEVTAVCDVWLPDVFPVQESCVALDERIIMRGRLFPERIQLFPDDDVGRRFRRALTSVPDGKTVTPPVIGWKKADAFWEKAAAHYYALVSATADS